MVREFLSMTTFRCTSSAPNRVTATATSVRCCPNKLSSSLTWRCMDLIRRLPLRRAEQMSPIRQFTLIPRSLAWSSMGTLWSWFAHQKAAIHPAVSPGRMHQRSTKIKSWWSMKWIARVPVCINAWLTISWESLFMRQWRWLFNVSLVFLFSIRKSFSLSFSQQKFLSLSLSKSFSLFLSEKASLSLSLFIFLFLSFPLSLFLSFWLFGLITFLN